MANKPTDNINWSFGTITHPVEEPDTERASGYAKDESLPAAQVNWWRRAIYRWIQWLATGGNYIEIATGYDQTDDYGSVRITRENGLAPGGVLRNFSTTNVLREHITSDGRLLYGFDANTAELVSIDPRDGTKTSVLSLTGHTFQTATMLTSHIQTNGRYLVSVSNNGTNWVVNTVDLLTNTITGSALTIPNIPSSVAINRTHMAVTYVKTGNDTMDIIRLVDNTLTVRVAFGGTGQHSRVAANDHGFFAPNTVAATNEIRGYDNTGSLMWTEIDPGTSSPPLMQAVGADRDSVYLIVGGTGPDFSRILRMNPLTGDVLAEQVLADLGPGATWILTDEDRVLVGFGASNPLYVLDRETLAPLWTLTGTIEGDRRWVSDRFSLYLLETGTAKEVDPGHLSRVFTKIPRAQAHLYGGVFVPQEKV